MKTQKKYSIILLFQTTMNSDYDVKYFQSDYELFLTLIIFDINNECNRVSHNPNDEYVPYGHSLNRSNFLYLSIIG